MAAGFVFALCQEHIPPGGGLCTDWQLEEWKRTDSERVFSFVHMYPRDGGKQAESMFPSIPSSAGSAHTAFSFPAGTGLGYMVSDFSSRSLRPPHSVILPAAVALCRCHPAAPCPSCIHFSHLLPGTSVTPCLCPATLEIQGVNSPGGQSLHPSRTAPWTLPTVRTSLTVYLEVGSPASPVPLLFLGIASPK